MSDEPAYSAFKSRSGWRRVVGALRYSLAGLRSAWKHEHAFRQEVAVIVPAAVVALLLPVTALEKLLLVASMALVLVVELLNSAIEAVVDRVSLERHPLSKNAKDFGSAAVMLALLLSAACWGVVLWGWWAGRSV
jgi:diacylglycerol kinase (ATP)